MLNDLRLLINVADVNVFDVVTTRDIYAGSYPVPFHIQLWQSDKGERFIPDISAVVKVQFLRMDTVGEEPSSQTVVKTLTQTFTEDPSIWGVDLASVDVANITTGGFRVILEEGTDVKQIYSVMSIRKNPTSDWMLPEEDGNPILPFTPIDSLWQRVGTILSPVFPGDDLDMGTGNIDTNGLIDGRDVSADGVLLDAHLIDDAAIKHDADEVDVQGTYVYISTGRLEGAIGDIDGELGTLHSLITSEDVWDRTGTVISPKTAGDDLDMGAGNLILTGNVDGRDVSVDGAALDLHLIDDAAIKHDANQIDVQGTYTYIGTGDAEAAMADIDAELGTIYGLITSEDIWNRTGITITPKNAGDDLDLGAGKLIGGSSPFVIESKESDGASAVGFRLNTQNSLATDGSVILELLNNSVDTFKIRQGEDLSAYASDSVLAEFYNAQGNLQRQISYIEDGSPNNLFIQDLMPASDTGSSEYWLELNNDFDYGDDYRSTYLDMASSALGFNFASLGTEQLVGGDETGMAEISVVSSATGAQFELVAEIGSLSQDVKYKAFAKDHTIFAGKTNTRHYWEVDNFPCLGIDADKAFIGKTSTSKWRFESLIANSASAVAFELDTLNALTTVGANILDIKNNNISKLVVDKDGNLNIAGQLTATALILSAGIEVARTAVAANYNVLITDYYLGVNTSIPIQIQLMSAIRSNGTVIEVKDETGGAGVNNITIITEGAETIDGAASYVINVNRGAVRFICDGTNWHAL